jgi:protein-disulfide isomerase
MASKQQNRSRRVKSHSQEQSQAGRSGLKTYVLIIGVVALAIVIVSGFAILKPGDSSPAPVQPAAVSLDKSLGAADAPVVVVEYADFQCPYCKQFATGPEQQLQKDYVDPGQVRFVFRHMAFIGQESTWAAEAAECANEQNRFWDYQNKLFAEQGVENSGTFSRENLKRFAAELGLDTQQFNQCLDSDKYQAKVQQEVAEGQRLGVNSTPSLFVNGQLIKNGSNYQVLQTAIEAALKK